MWMTYRVVPVTRTFTGLFEALLVIEMSTVNTVFAAVPAGGVKLIVTEQFFPTATLLQPTCAALNRCAAFVPDTVATVKNGVPARLNGAVPVLVSVTRAVPVVPARVRTVVVAATEMVPWAPVPVRAIVWFGMTTAT